MLKKSLNYFKIILINFLILYVLLYILEISLQINYNSFLNESKYFYRDKVESSVSHTVDLAFAPYKLLNSGTKILPLSGVSSSRTILCSEDNKNYYEYFSDKNGFNNSDENKNFDLMIIGDSYVHGLCLDQKFNLPNKISEHGISVKNLGIMANGPLFEYAIFREYHEIYNFKTLVWLFNPDNDFYDFSFEINNEILKKYLREKDFNQSLINKNKQKDEIIRNYFNYENRRLKEILKHYHLDIKLVRNIISNIIDYYRIESVHDVGKNKKNNINHIEKIFYILNDVNNILIDRNINFVVIFNSNHPMYTFPKNEIFLNDNLLIIEQTKELKELLDVNNISNYDFNDFVINNYTKENIYQIYKKVSGPKEFDHFTKNGNEILSNIIVQQIGLSSSNNH